MDQQLEKKLIQAFDLVTQHSFNPEEIRCWVRARIVLPELNNSEIEAFLMLAQKGVPYTNILWQIERARVEHNARCEQSRLHPEQKNLPAKKREAKRYLNTKSYIRFEADEVDRLK